MTGRRDYIERIGSGSGGRREGRAFAERPDEMPGFNRASGEDFGPVLAAGRNETAMQAAVNTNIEHLPNRFVKADPLSKTCLAP
jgi:hypothetical protein